MTDTFTPERLAEITERCEKATDGPWDTDGYASVIGPDGEQIVTAPCYESKDQQLRDDIFIAHARTDLPDALSHITAQTAEIVQLKKVQTACSDRIGELLTRTGAQAAEIERLRGDAEYWEGRLTVQQGMTITHKKIEERARAQLTRYKAVVDAARMVIRKSVYGNVWTVKLAKALAALEDGEQPPRQMGMDYDN